MQPLRWRGVGGFTTIELLIASAVLLVVTGAVAAMATPMREAVERSLGRTDLTGGSRFALERLTADLKEAGSPASVVPEGRPLAALIPTIVPLEDLDSGSVQSPGTAVQTMSVPHLAPQGVLGTVAATGTVFVELDASAPCTAIGPACGFRDGMPGVLYDDTRAAVVSIHSVGDTGTVRLAAPLPATFAPGAVLAALSITSYGLRADADGSWRLVRIHQGSEQPVLDHVVDFVVETHGPDPLHVTRVDLRVRLESASAALRGPAGHLFRRAGSSTRARQWVPDFELRASVAPRQVAP